MFTFLDENGFQVELYFDGTPFDEIEPKHVLIVVTKDNQFLCTIHRKRGIEFPGGKVEGNETLAEAAIREVYEETGVKITKPLLLGHYIVRDKEPFCKVIYHATVEEQVEYAFLHETSGRIWLTEEQLWQQPNLSFYMRDDGMKQIVQEVKRHEQER